MKITTRTNPTTGKKYFILDFYHRGQRYKRTIPNVSGIKEAREAGIGLYKRLTEGELDHGTTIGPVLTVGKLLSLDAQRAGISPWTRKGELEAHTAFLRHVTSTLPVSALTGQMLEHYKREREKSGVKPRSINYPLQVLRAALNRAKRNGLIASVPVTVEFVPDIKKRPRHLTATQAQALVEAAAKKRIQTEVILLLNTGLRRGELYRLRWSDVDLDNRTLKIVTTKRGKSQEQREDVLPLNTAVVDCLRSLKRTSGLILGRPPEVRRDLRNPKVKPEKRGHYGGVECLHDYGFRDKLKAAAKLAGIPEPEKITPHVLRHTFATLTHANGASIKNVSALVRHRSSQLTIQLYAHEQMEGMRKAVDSLVPGTQPGTTEDRKPRIFSRIKLRKKTA